jgi:hypothetical protein
MEKKVVAPEGPSSIEKITPSVPKTDNNKNGFMENAASGQSVIVLGKTEGSTTQPATASQQQIMELRTMIEAMQMFQQKTEQTHRDRHDTLTQALKDVKLQLQHSLDAVGIQKVLGDSKRESKAASDHLTKKGEAAQEESTRRLTLLEKIMTKQGLLIKKLGDRDAAPVVAPKEDNAKLEQLEKIISNQEEVIKQLKDGEYAGKALQDEYTKKLEEFDGTLEIQKSDAEKLVNRTTEVAAREEVVKNRELALAAQAEAFKKHELALAAREEAFKKRELTLAAREKAIKQREQVPKIEKAKETVTPQAQPTKIGLAVQPTTVLAPSSSDLVLATPPVTSEAAAAASGTKSLKLSFFSSRALSSQHLALLKTPKPTTSTALAELAVILEQLHVPHGVLERHATHILDIFAFQSAFNKSTIEYPAGFDLPLAKWCSNMRECFHDQELWLNVEQMAIWHDEMLQLQILVNSFDKVTPALKTIDNEQDIRIFAGMAKEYIDAGKALIANMPAGYEYKRGLEKWVNAEHLRCLKGVRRVQANWMIIVHDDWTVEDEEL